MIEMVIALALVVTVAAAYLAHAFPKFGRLKGRGESAGPPTHSFAILIPAHNEQSTLPATLQNLSVLDYPPELVRVFVVADHCSDRTATVARWAGAVCLKHENSADRGKGLAVAFGLEIINRELPDVVLILNANCRLNPTALRELDTAFARGADAVQCAVRTEKADAAVDSDSQDRNASRNTGIALRRVMLHRVPWKGMSEEEYTRQLRKSHVRVRHCPRAVVSSQDLRQAC